MALFGIKKIKNNKTFINNDVINAPDDVTVPDNNVDYDNSTQGVTNESVESTIENVESTPNTFVYSQVDNVDAFNNNSNQLDDSVVMTVDKNVFSAPAGQVMTDVQAENYQVNTDQQAVYIPQPEFSSEQAVAQDYNMNQTVQADYNFSQQDAYVSQPEFSGQDQVMYGNQTEYSGEQQSIQTEYVPQQQEMYVQQPGYASQSEFSNQAQTMYTSQPDINYYQGGYENVQQGQPEYSEVQQVVQPQLNEEVNNVSIEQPVQVTQQSDVYVPQPEFSDSPQNMEASQVTEESPALPEEVQPDVSQLQSLMFPDKSKEEVVVPVQEEEEVAPSVFDTSKELPTNTETIKYDPLNNATNPVPVNPTSSEPDDDIIIFDEEEDVKVDVVSVIKMMFCILLKPATVIGANVKKYNQISKSILLLFWISMFSLVFCLLGRLVAGVFSTTQNAITGATKITLNFSGLLQPSNYIPYVIATLMIGLVAVLVVSLVYYLSSFIHSKGVHLAVYIALSSLALVPLILCFTLIYPIVSIFSTDIAFIFLLFGIVFSIVILITGVNSIVKYKSKDGKILYNAINLTIIFSVMIFIFNTLSKLHILELAMLFR